MVNRFSSKPAHVVIRRGGGDYLSDPDEIRGVAQELLRLATVMEASPDPTSFSQQEYRKREAYDLLCEIAQAGRWQYASDAPIRLSEADSASPQTPYVYFAKSPVYNALIKIGATRDPISRMKQLAREHFKEDLEIIALCQTEHYMDFEKYLHYYFEREKVFGEFYRETSVTWFLNYIRMLMREQSST